MIQTIGGINTDVGESIQPTSDGGYIIAGYTWPEGSDYSDVYLIKIDSSCTEQWSQSLVGRDQEFGFDVQQTSDGGYIITGYTDIYGVGEDLYLIKTDSSGTAQWSQTFGGSDTDQGWSVKQTSDGGYIVTGETRSYGAGDWDVWLIRLDSEGTAPDVVVTLIPYGTPIQIPASGGSFDFNIEVANNGSSSETFDIWTMATLPNGSEYGPIINVQDFTAPASWSTNRDRAQAVPAVAPTGMYTYDAYVGAYPYIVWDEDHFDFEKLAAGDGTPVTGWTCWGESFEEAVQQHEIVPAEIAFSSAFPNPFNPMTTIHFALPQASQVVLAVYDLHGRLISELINGMREAGNHEVTWDASHLSSGLYFYQIQAGDFSDVKKMVLVK